MRSRISIVTISAITFGAALLLGTAATAGEPVHVGGRMTCKTPEQHPGPVEGDPGHVLESRPASAARPAIPRGSTAGSKHGSK